MVGMMHLLVLCSFCCTMYADAITQELLIELLFNFVIFKVIRRRNMASIIYDLDSLVGDSFPETSCIQF